MIVPAIVAFVLVFAGVYYANYAGIASVVFTVPYSYIPGEWLSEVNAFFFVFVLSLLFYGMSAPIALGIEALKYGSLISIGTANPFTIIFFGPQLVACYSAVLLGQGILRDYEEKEVLYRNAKRAAKYFLFALALLVVFILVYSFVNAPVE
jgi:hypothetical protein